MFKIELGYLSEEHEVAVVSQTTQTHDNAIVHPLGAEDILDFQRIARQVPAAEAVIQYAVRLVHASRPQSESAPDFIKDWVSWGAGIRASQNLILAGKVRALLMGRYNVSYGDVILCAGGAAMVVPLFRRAGGDGVPELKLYRDGSGKSAFVLST